MSLLNTLTDQFHRLRRARSPQGLGVSAKELDGWQLTPLGRAILDLQRQQLEDILGELFGYHLLQISVFNVDDLANSSRINHRFNVGPVASGSVSALAHPEQMPLESESIDVVLLHHVLEYSSHPHQLLREANRVLIGRGHLVVIGFNPWSLQGVYKVFKQMFNAGIFWRRHGLRAGRIADWLKLLDCDTVRLERGFYRLPVNSEAALNRFRFWERLCTRFRLPIGGYYILVAQKERLRVTPVKPSWQSFNPISGLGLSKPTSRMPETAKKQSTNGLSCDRSQ